VLRQTALKVQQSRKFKPALHFAVARIKF